MRNLLLSLLLLSQISITSAQTDELPFIRNQDLSYLISGDSIEQRTEDYGWDISYRPEPVGYIGDHFKRLRIHWSEVQKSPDDPLVYLVSGKSKVGDNICAFSGELRITEAWQDASEEFTDEEMGIVHGTLHLAEEREEKGTGIFTGTFWLRYWLPHGKAGPPLAAEGPRRSLDHADEQLVYNSLGMDDPSFGNHQFNGQWTSYRSGNSQPFAWADFRFSYPTDLDAGASEFSPSKTYHDQGWRNYYRAYIHADSEAERTAALEEELRAWWK